MKVNKITDRASFSWKESRALMVMDYVIRVGLPMLGVGIVRDNDHGCSLVLFDCIDSI